MRIEYQRGTAVLGPLVMKRLEEADLAVVDADEFLKLIDQHTRLEAFMLELVNLNSDLQKMLDQAARERREARLQAEPTAASSGNVAPRLPRRSGKARQETE